MTLFAHVMPPPAPPVHPVDHWPLRSHCSDSHTGACVLIRPLAPPMYVCVVMAPSMDSAPWDLMPLSMLAPLPQPAVSQQVILVCFPKPAFSKVGCRTLMKAAAELPSHWHEAYEALEQSLENKRQATEGGIQGKLTKSQAHSSAQGR